MKKIILISGKKESGKGILTSFLKAEDASIKVVSFAKALKKGAEPLLKSMHLDISKRADKEVARPLLQALGKVGRDIDPLYWVKKSFNEITDDGIYVIDDLRFLNEYNFFNNLDKNEYQVYFIRIEKDLIKSDDHDISEIDLDNKENLFNLVLKSSDLYSLNNSNVLLNIENDIKIAKSIIKKIK